MLAQGGLNRGIALIDYDNQGHPTRIQFTDGSVTSYEYTADGRRLKTKHETAVEGITVPVNTRHELTNAETLAKDSTEYLGNFRYHNNQYERYEFPGGYATPKPSYAVFNMDFHFYVKDHLGSNVMVLCNTGIEQQTRYYPFGGIVTHNSTNGNTNHNKYTGKEFDRMHGLDWYDYVARQYDPIYGRFTSIDPLCEKYPYLSPYAYCGNNPIRFIDPDGRDWYQNNKTKYYTWYEGQEERDGYTHIGGKGSVLGEFEPIIDNILSGKEGLGMESLYSEGFTFDIAPNDKGGLIKSKERGWDLFDEFIYGIGPEFSVFLSDHPYTKELMKQSKVIESQEEIRKRGIYGNIKNVNGGTFLPHMAPLNSPMQFIGSYRYDGYSSKDGIYINNVVFDSKSLTSLFYHLPFKNHRRSVSSKYGNTYQFYIWRTKK